MGAVSMAIMVVALAMATVVAAVPDAWAQTPAAPTFTAETTSTTTVRLTFTENLTGVTDATEWGVTGVMVTDTNASMNRITLIHSGLSADATPVITYSGTSLAGSTSTVAVAAVSASDNLQATDGVAPTFMAATATPTTITITFNESVTGTTAATEWGAGLATVSGVTPMSPSIGVTEFVITHSGLVPGAEPFITYSGTTLQDDATNPVATVGSNEIRAADGVAPTFTAETRSTTTVRVQFNESVTGTTRGTDWSVAGATVSSVEPTSPVIVTVFTITHSGLSASATPAIRYTGTGLADPNGNSIPVTPSPGVTATENIVPTFEAKVLDGGMLEIKFSTGFRSDLSTDSRRAAGAGLDPIADFYIHAYDETLPTGSDIRRSYTDNSRFINNAGPTERYPNLAVTASSLTFTEGSTTLNLAFTGEKAKRFQTSTPLIVYSYPLGVAFGVSSSDTLLNNTKVRATDDASPVGIAEFVDSDTIRVILSEEMATPLGTRTSAAGVVPAVIEATGITVADSGGNTVALSTSSPPTFTAHTPPKVTHPRHPFLHPTLEINLAAPATGGSAYTIDFGSLVAAGGPAGKRAVADTTITAPSNPPTFTVNKLSNTRLMVTFSEEVRQISGTTQALADWSIEQSPSDSTANIVAPTAVEYGFNYADLTLAAGVTMTDLPTVRYAPLTSAIESLSGADLPITPTGSPIASSATPIPLSASHTRTATGTSEITVTFSDRVQVQPASTMVPVSDFDIPGITIGTVTFTNPSDTATLGGFSADPAEVYRVSYTGTTMVPNIAGDLADLPRVPMRTVEASDGYPPRILSARTTSTTTIDVTLSEAIEFKSSSATAAQQNAHWKTTLGSTDTAVTGVAISGSTVTLTVASANAWGATDVPDVKYDREVSSVTGSDNGRITDGGDNELLDDTFTDTVNGLTFTANSITTGAVLTDIGDQRDPADNTYDEYIDVELTRLVEIRSGTMAQRVAHWTVTDDSGTAVTVEDVELVAETPGQPSTTVRLNLASNLPSTGETPTVLYTQGTLQGSINLAGETERLATFGAAIEADDGIPPRLTEYPTAADSTPGTADNDRLAIGFTFSEEIDPDSLGDATELAYISHQLQVATSMVPGSQRALSGSQELHHNNCESGTSWLATSYGILRSADSGATFTTTDTTVDPYLGADGNFVRYVFAAPSNTRNDPQEVTGFCITETARPQDTADNYYVTNLDDSMPLDGQAAFVADGGSAAAYRADRDNFHLYDPATRGAYGMFNVVLDKTGPEFLAAARSETTVDVLYREPVKLVDGATLDAAEWRLDLTPNVSTDNDDTSANWVTPDTISHEFDEFDNPYYWAYGRDGNRDDFEPIDGTRLTITLGGFTDLDPNLKSAATDLRPTIHYIADGSSDVIDMYGNLAPATANARLVDATPPLPTVAFTSLTEATFTYQEPIGAYGTSTSYDIYLTGGAPADSIIQQPTTYTPATSSAPASVRATLSSTPTDAEYTARIHSGGPVTDTLGPTGAVAPLTWYDRNEHGTVPASPNIPATNIIVKPAFITGLTLPQPPTFTATTTSINTVDLEFSESVARVDATPLNVANWAAELVAADATPTARTPTTTDDIAVMAVSTLANDMLTLTLDPADANIGNTAKKVFITYTASTSEIVSSPPAATLARNLAQNTAALATDGAPPIPTAAITALREITLTFAEAPTADPTRTGITYEVYTIADTATNLASSTAPTYTAATSSTPATVTIPIAADLANTMHTVRITSSATASIMDAVMERLPDTQDISVPTPPGPTFSGVTTAQDKVLITFGSTVERIGVTPADLDFTNWAAELVAADATPTARTSATTDDIAVTAVSALASNMLTLTLDPADANIGDTTKKVFVTYTASTSEIRNEFGIGLAQNEGGLATDAAPPEILSAITASELTSRGANPDDPADDVHSDYTLVTFSEPVRITPGSSTLRSAHWSLSDDDPDAASPGDGPSVRVTGASVEDIGVVRISHDSLSSTASTPYIEYDPTTSDFGRIASEVGTLSAMTIGIAGELEVADGISPRLVGLPTRGDLTPSTSGNDMEAIVFEFSEALDPDSVVTDGMAGDALGNHARAVLLRANIQVESSSPTGSRAPVRDDGSSCFTGTDWLPTSGQFALNADGSTHLGDDGNTLRVTGPSARASATVDQGLGWICLTSASASSLYDVAGNLYTSPHELPHDQFIIVHDSTPPEFIAGVTSETTIEVIYREPVKFMTGAVLEGSDWRVDTTPNIDTDNDDSSPTTWVTPTVSHSFGAFVQPEFFAYGAPNHVLDVEMHEDFPEAQRHIDTNSQLTVTLGGLTGLDPNRAAATPDLRPVVNYVGTNDIADMYDNVAPTDVTARTMDSTPPRVMTISTAVTTAATETLPIPDRQFARAEDPFVVTVRFAVTLDEDQKTGEIPAIALFNGGFRSFTTVPATPAEQAEDRVWPMIRTTTGNERMWHFDWAVTPNFAGESSNRNWDGGVNVPFGIRVSDAEDNVAIYTHRSTYTDGNAIVRVDTRAPVITEQSLMGRLAGSTGEYTSSVGRDGGGIALTFTMDETPERLVGFDKDDITFFTDTAATSLSGTGTSSDPYVATSVIPEGHAEGFNAVDWTITVMDKYGRSTTLSNDPADLDDSTAGLGFRVDNTAPVITASSVTIDQTMYPTRATDRSKAGDTITTMVTFNEPILMAPSVMGTGSTLGEAGARVSAEFRIPEPVMTEVDGSDMMEWTHEFTVPERADMELLDAVYKPSILMQADEAGNEAMLMILEDEVRMDNVPPSVTNAAVLVRTDSMGNSDPWLALYYDEADALDTSTIRLYRNTTIAEHIDLASGTLLMNTRINFAQAHCDIENSELVCPVSSTGHDVGARFEISFDQGSGTPDATSLTDLSHNPISWDQPPARPDPASTSGARLGVSGFDLLTLDFLGTAPVPISGSGNGDPIVSLGGTGLTAAGGALTDTILYAPQQAPDVEVLLAQDTEALGLDDPTDANDVPMLALLEREAGHETGTTAYYTSLLEDVQYGDDSERATRALATRAPLSVVDAGSAERKVVLSEPARIGIRGAESSLYVYYIEGTDTMTRTDDVLHAIDECEDSSVDTVDTSEVGPHMGAPNVASGTGTDDAECFVRGSDTLYIWTNHFTPFGASSQQLSRGGSGCDDCTSPTLGIDSTGERRVSGGFTYNGEVHDVEYYYTPMPLIEVETGVENVAVLKIYEDSGVSRIAHAGLAFGLGRGQHFAESEAGISVDISHTGALSVSLDDASGAIDAETLRATAERTDCMRGSVAECLEVTIYHTFREPLDFDVVSTSIWDTRLNSWQNFFNHGVHVDGESLNPSRGVEVNGGELVLFPLISAHVDEDGDGIYDYDERHVTYMLDENYSVWRLTPDGTYAPLRNLYSLYHEIDDSMYADARIRTHGAERSSDLFAVELDRQEKIAMEIMAEMGVAIEVDDVPEAVASPYEDMVLIPRLERLSDDIAQEINLAERILDSIRE